MKRVTAISNLNGLMCSAAMAAGLSMGAAAAYSQTDAIAEFYDGQTITIYVGFGPGGGYDLYGRLAADFLGKHIPGNPDVIVENMPGAGGRLAAQYLYSVAPQDGTALSVIVQSVGMDSALGTIPGNVDAAQFAAIGRLTANYELGIAWAGAEAQNFEDAKTVPVPFASTGAGSASAFVPRMLNDIEGTQFEVIAGYQGTSNAAIAMEQSEVDAMMIGIAGLRASRPDWLDNGMVNVLWQLSNEPHPDFMDVPAVGQLGTTDEERQMLQLVAGAAGVGRSLVTTPNVPAERVEALRRAFDAMLEDEAFLAAATERNQELDPISGEALQDVINSQMDVSPDALERVRAYVMAN
ncbi:Bug family tripartite tricarboxylate transporter substrate binding protein [Roseicitreum antarcticum]|uniref:Tripartite-type tricarboxylate transporter, receptor component TctC n=1 Tax=Roseicitreum antarcticum TaxID=564137 RepID=A0A1H2W1P4_9RHOB|nr:tripartite tricarboxylate transporter substrate-binding protein [Roseicitreum antarcticum]SDW74500.1 Tripartite-type tricarboxylate transporter, receptor component TctC [Roseicitreum antarcticum]